MDKATIFELQQALEPVLGIEGARLQILGALRRGEMQARCATFVGLNARDYSTPAYPESGPDAVLPIQFWAPVTWLRDGEHRLPGLRRADIWTTMTSWQRGDFIISGSFGRGKIPVSRQAFGVLIAEPEASEFLAKFAVTRRTPAPLRRRPRSTADLISDDVRDAWIRAYEGRNSTKAWKAYRREFGEAGGTREHDFHPAWMRIHGNPSRGAARRRNPERL